MKSPFKINIYFCYFRVCVYVSVYVSTGEYWCPLMILNFLAWVLGLEHLSSVGAGTHG